MSHKRISHQKGDGTWVFRWVLVGRRKRYKERQRKSGLCVDNRHNLVMGTEEDGTVQKRLGEEENDI